MINPKQLTPLDKWTLHTDGEENRLDLEYCATMIKEQSALYAVPIHIEREQINVGNFFKKEMVDVLVLSHPEHPKDYLKFVFQIRNQGIMQIIQVDNMGQSKQLKKAGISEANAAHRQARMDSSDHTMTSKIAYQIGNRIGNAIATIGKNQAKLAAENEYYELVLGILAQFKE